MSSEASSAALVEESIERFCAALHARTPTPGGGAAAAATAAMGTALAGMVVRFSRREAEPEVLAVQDTVDQGLLEIRRRLGTRMDEDVRAYEAVLACPRPSQVPEAQREDARRKRRQALQRAAAVPLGTARLALDAMELLEGLLSTLSRTLRSDASCAALLLRAAVRSALDNVKINLPRADAQDAEERELRRRADQVDRRAAELETSIVRWAEGPAAP